MLKQRASAEIMGQVDAVFDSFEPKQSDALQTTFARLLEIMPTATIDMSWGMPTLRTENVSVVSLLGFTNHNSLFPGPQAIEIMGEKLDGFTVTKGTIHFDKHRACTKVFLKDLVAACISAINAQYPKKSGEFKEFYANGVLKATGKYKAEAMHGDWRFFRKNGVLMRSGSFTHGEQSGTWVTYDSNGDVYKTTQLKQP
jgi:uncharacterized protein YdhG (YjbR/CyaY superfamily)